MIGGRDMQLKRIGSLTERTIEVHKSNPKAPCLIKSVGGLK
jgi:hypothetical protein